MIDRFLNAVLKVGNKNTGVLLELYSKVWKIMEVWKQDASATEVIVISFTAQKIKFLADLVTFTEEILYFFISCKVFIVIMELIEANILKYFQGGRFDELENHGQVVVVCSLIFFKK